MQLQTVFLREPKAYTGVELRPHFLLTELGLKGSALGAFVGPCQVKTEHLVDWEDRLANDHIAAGEMVHFIGEFFGASLREGVLWQRLIVSTLQAQLNAKLSQAGKSLLIRQGDDLFYGDRKLSVSIVTASPVSQLLHLGINVDPTGAPVKAVGVRELGLAPEAWVPKLLETISAEWNDLDWACAKVRPVV